MINRTPFKPLTLLAIIVITTLTINVLIGEVLAFASGQPAATAIIPEISNQPYQTQAVLSGWLAVVWDDSIQKPQTTPMFYLIGGGANPTRLVLNEAFIHSLGEIQALSGQRVVVEGNWMVGSRSEIGRPSLKVQTIALKSSPGHSISRNSPTNIVGPQPWVSILCKFSDEPGEPQPVSYFEGLMGSTYPGLDHYWREASYDKINLEGSSSVGWYTLPYPKSYYVYGDPPQFDIYAFLYDCIAVADADVYFPDYVGINLMSNHYIGPGAFGGSGLYLDLDGDAKPYGVTWLAQYAWEYQATVAHEIGHGFGLPHSGGAGQVYNDPWDVMGNSFICPSNDPIYGCVAQGTIAYHKDILGWIPAEQKQSIPWGSEATITLEQLARPQSDNYLMAEIPLCPAGHSYTVEARRFTGYDEILLGEAVIIHEIDNVTRPLDPAHVIDSDGNGDTGDAGAMWIPGETFIDPANGITVTVKSATATGYKVTIKNKPLRLCNLTITGATAGIVQTSHTFAASVGLPTAAQPITYVWQASGQSPITHTGGLSDTVTFTWSEPGNQIITATATNAVETVTQTFKFLTYSGNLVYSNDFEDIVGPEWSIKSTDTTPVGGRQFLGQFLNDEVALTLNDLPPHESLTLSFDLYVINSWDGSDSPYGPDIWSVAANSAPLLYTTFSNLDESSSSQAYPGEYPADSYLPQTGATEIDTLGYHYFGNSVYRLTFRVADSSSSLVLAFSAAGLLSLEDESWGLDNVIVATAEKGGNEAYLPNLLK